MKWYRDWTERLGLSTRPRLRKTIVAVIGTTVVLFGLALIVLPGPAIIVVPLGVAILATEFAWARALAKRGEAYWGRARRWRRRPPPEKPNPLGNDPV